MARKRARATVESRSDYMTSRTRDLTRYASLVGDGLAAKVDLLAQVLGDVHEPSLGRYKERLLSEAIAAFLPRRYEVVTGFVLFPRARRFASARPQGFDYLNSSDFVPSRRCDILVVDTAHYPPVFRDGDFVVVRPESVRAMVEVKGVLSPKSVSDAIKAVIDFGSKWRDCSVFYQQAHAKELARPFLGVMAWRVAVDSRGRARTNGRQIRENLVAAYSKLQKSQLRGLPVLDSLLLHRDFEIMATTFSEADESLSFGFLTRRGNAVRFTESGEAQLAGDNTVNSLLASIHVNLETPYNRFFSRSDQSNSDSGFPHLDSGYSPWLFGKEANLPYQEIECSR